MLHIALTLELLGARLKLKSGLGAQLLAQTVFNLFLQMRLPVLVLAALLAAPVLAQAQTAPPDYETQLKTLQAPRVDTLDELRDGGRGLVGKTVELRGTIKGAFGGAEAFSVLLELANGQTQLLEVGPMWKDSPLVRVGAWARVLCKIQASVGTELLLQLVNATDQQEAQLFADDAPGPDLIRVPRDVPGAPPPSDILIAPEVNLPASPTSSPPLPVAPSVRVQPRPQPRSNAFYGFDDVSRNAFGALARRHNPRLDDEGADAIAVSLLEAAQSQNLDPRFLAAVVQVESRFNPYAVSSAGAMGLGQLMPFNLRSLGVQNAWDVRQNLRGAAKLLRQNLNVYARDPNGTMLAVAAYHAGVGAVNRAGKAIPKATTQRYVWKVYYAYRALAPELFR